MNPLLLFKLKNFVLNTSLFTFYTTLCISIRSYMILCMAMVQVATGLLSQAYLYACMVERNESYRC